MFEVIVKGLSFKAYDNDVAQLFEPCGNVLDVKLLQKDGRSKGMAFIKFSKKSSFNQALELNETEHMGRVIKVEESQGRQDNRNNTQRDFGNNKQNNSWHGNNNQQGGQKRQFQPNQKGQVNIETPTLFIGGLSYQSTNDSVREFFSQIGEVASARVVTDKETGNVAFLSLSLEDSDMSSSMTLKLPSRPMSR